MIWYINEKQANRNPRTKKLTKKNKKTNFVNLLTLLLLTPASLFSFPVHRRLFNGPSWFPLFPLLPLDWFITPPPVLPLNAMVDQYTYRFDMLVSFVYIYSNYDSILSLLFHDKSIYDHIFDKILWPFKRLAMLLIIIVLAIFINEKYAALTHCKISIYSNEFQRTYIYIYVEDEWYSVPLTWCPRTWF